MQQAQRLHRAPAQARQALAQVQVQAQQALALRAPARLAQQEEWVAAQLPALRQRAELVFPRSLFQPGVAQVVGPPCQQQHLLLPLPQLHPPPQHPQHNLPPEVVPAVLPELSSARLMGPSSASALLEVL